MTDITDIPQLPDRPDDAHKGTFGTVYVIGGSPTMIGAPALCAGAALRAGCGLAKIVTWPELIPHVLTIEPSATAMEIPYLDNEAEVRRFADSLGDHAVLAVGPGMSQREQAVRGVEVVLQRERPVVLDADGLNNLAKLGSRVGKPACPLVMTPHPGEYARLAAASNIDTDPVDPAQRPAAAARLAERYGAVVVLKGRHTIVSDGDRRYVNQTGNPALSTAGSGDILTGMVASLMAQGMDRFDAAVLGVHLHGLAADIWAEQFGPVGLMARDLAELIPEAMHRYRESQ